VYLSEHPAVALIEALANLKGNPALFPEKYQLIEVHIAEGVYSAMTALADLKGNPFGPNAPIQATRRVGDDWLQNKASALVSMPSFPSPRSMNTLVNPLHPDAGKVIIANCSWIKYDKRLFHAHASPIPSP
jgi:RES domain-containing protein